MFRDGDVLYGKLRPYLNKVCVPDFDGICSTDILVFPQTDHVHNRFLLRYLQRQDVVDFASHNMTGVQLPRISFKKLASMPLPLPPLPEQRRLAAQIDALLSRAAAARERLTNVPVIMKRFRQSALAAACSGRLTPKRKRRKRKPPAP